MSANPVLGWMGLGWAGWGCNMVSHPPGPVFAQGQAQAVGIIVLSPGRSHMWPTHSSSTGAAFTSLTLPAVSIRAEGPPNTSASAWTLVVRPAIVACTATIAALRAALGEACELGEPGGRMSPTKRDQKVLTAATTTW